jgi:hypothetical protein
VRVGRFGWSRLARAPSPAGGLDENFFDLTVESADN